MRIPFLHRPRKRRGLLNWRAGLLAGTAAAAGLYAWKSGAFGRTSRETQGEDARLPKSDLADYSEARPVSEADGKTIARPVESLAPAAMAGVSGLAGPRDLPEEGALSKMTSGGEELRGRDFPQSHRRSEEDLRADAADTEILEPEEIQAGGEVGEIIGDRQSFGEAPTIMDQDEVTPDFAQQR